MEALGATAEGRGVARLCKARGHVRKRGNSQCNIGKNCGQVGRGGFDSMGLVERRERKCKGGDEAAAPCGYGVIAPAGAGLRGHGLR